MIYECVVSLRVFSESATAAELAERLSATPDASHDKGDEISSRRLPSPVRPSSHWRKSFRESGEHCVERAFSRLTDFLGSHASRIEALEECDTDVSFGAFTDVEQLNLVVPARAMKTMAELDLDLVLSGYLVPDRLGAEAELLGERGDGASCAGELEDLSAELRGVRGTGLGPLPYTQRQGAPASSRS